MNVLEFLFGKYIRERMSTNQKEIRPGTREWYSDKQLYRKIFQH